MIAIVGIRCRNDAHYTLYMSCRLVYGIAIARLLSFLFVDDEGITFLSLSNLLL